MVIHETITFNQLYFFMDITIYGDWIDAYWYTTFRKESKDINAICSELRGPFLNLLWEKSGKCTAAVVLFWMNYPHCPLLLTLNSNEWVGDCCECVLINFVPGTLSLGCLEALTSLSMQTEFPLWSYEQWNWIKWIEDYSVWNNNELKGNYLTPACL